jgi:casein kinase 1
MASSSSNVVGVHYRVGKKIGEGSFGVIFEGTNLLNNQQVAIKFVCFHSKKKKKAVAERKQRMWEKKETKLRRKKNESSLFSAEQEPRKSDAPQLRDEYRTYKILVGCREFQLFFPAS